MYHISFLSEMCINDEKSLRNGFKLGNVVDL